MALANKNHIPNESTNPIIQASPFHQHNLFGNNRNRAYREPETPEKAKLGLATNFSMSNSSSVSSPSSTISSFNHLSEEGNSVISFKPEYGDFACGPFLSFDQQRKNPPQRNMFSKMIEQGAGDDEEEYPVWDQNGYNNDMQFAWMNGELANAISGNVQELGSNNKRPSMGVNVQALKKQCVADSKKARLKSASTSNDPQSVAAKNRRERISERLKILQDLVPNGSKVDLVTMLEKAIGYVKFLQLQVKVLATDDFWPAQGGKAPDLSQVREAIDSILASQRDRNSSSAEPKQRQE